MSGPHLALFIYFSTHSVEKLNSLMTLSWLGGAVVTHSFWVQEVPGSIPISGKGFYVWHFVLLLLLLCFYLFVKKQTHFCHKSLQFLLQF